MATKAIKSFVDRWREKASPRQIIRMDRNE